MRSHLYRPIQDAAGNLRINATVRLIDPDTLSTSTIDIFDTSTGSTTLDNPFVVGDGIVDVWFDVPAVFNIGIVPVDGVQESVIEGIYPDGALDMLALRTTDAVLIYTVSLPLRTDVTSDPQRRVRWVGPFQPDTTAGHFIDGLDVWERTT